MATLSLGVPNWGGWLGDDWRRLVDVARAAEDAGVHRIVVNDHVVMGRRTDAYSWGRFPTAPEAPWLEPLTVLAAMASATSSLRLSTGVLVAPLRPAALLAKTVATLDVLSGGRVDLGVGVGWQREEYAALGVDFAARGRLLTETIRTCRALWTGAPVRLGGDEVFCSPLPAQPRVPVWFGGTLNDRMLSRVDELGDGWIAIMGAGLDDLRAGAARLSGLGRAVGVQAPARVVRGDVDATVANVPPLLEAGVTDVYVHAAALAADPAELVALLPLLAKRFEEVA